MTPFVRSALQSNPSAVRGSLARRSCQRLAFCLLSFDGRFGNTSFPIRFGILLRFFVESSVRFDMVQCEGHDFQKVLYSVAVFTKVPCSSRDAMFVLRPYFSPRSLKPSHLICKAWPSGAAPRPECLDFHITLPQFAKIWHPGFGCAPPALWVLLVQTACP